MSITPITAEQQYFARRVAAGTGLTLAAVLAWMHAENGPITNPLNMMIPGTQTVQDYGTAANAADAVIGNLRTHLYTPVMDTVRANPGDTKAQLLSIAQSPWDAGRYTGSQNGKPAPGVPWGTTLLGALAANPASGGGYFGSGIVSGAEDAAGAAAGAVSGAANSAAGFLNDYLNPKEWVKGVTGWVTNQAATGLAYVVLTVLGVALVFIGLNEATGREATRHLASGKSIAEIGATV